MTAVHSMLLRVLLSRAGEAGSCYSAAAAALAVRPWPAFALTRASEASRVQNSTQRKLTAYLATLASVLTRAAPRYVDRFRACSDGGTD